MPIEHSRINDIIREALSTKKEGPCIEFKKNNADPQEIGEYISALSNTAALYDQNFGFVIWGIDDVTHEIVGTDFDPHKAKNGNQSLDLWISTQLDPQVQFFFHKTTLDKKNVVLLEITAANSTPVKFRNIDYIRIGSNKKKLKDFSEAERQLWTAFSKKSFEEHIAVENISGEMTLQLLDYPSYFDMLSLEPPRNEIAVIERLQVEKMIVRNEAGNYNITNLGAVLFAKRLSDFPSLERKAIRVIKYSGDTKVSSESKEQISSKGYANGFEWLIEYINGMVPINEVVGTALRKNVPMYPKLAIRELIANLIIHQNFSLQGTGPVVELFESRIEITNPGAPLIEKSRFIDHPPISRNEKLANVMRRIGICEERGSGFDKVVSLTELYQLPAPEIEIYDNHTKVILYAHKPFAKMEKADKQRACYLHACLKRVNREYMTNSSLRERFAVETKNSSMISRLLNETCNAGLIKISDESTSDKNRKYLPYWA